MSTRLQAARLRVGATAPGSLEAANAIDDVFDELSYLIADGRLATEACATLITALMARDAELTDLIGELRDACTERS